MIGKISQQFFDLLPELCLSIFVEHFRHTPVSVKMHSFALINRLSGRMSWESLRLVCGGGSLLEEGYLGGVKGDF